MPLGRKTKKQLIEEIEALRRRVAALEKKPRPTEIAGGALSNFQFRVLIESTNQGVLVHRNHKALYANQALAALYGYASAEEILALESTELLFPPKDRGSERHEARLRGEDVPTDHEYLGLRKNGQEIWVNSRSFLVDWDGEPAVCSMRVDVTTRRTLEEERNQSQKLGALGGLAAGISHNFNNMLTPILTLSEMAIAEFPEDSKKRERMEAVVTAGLSARDLIQQILDFSQRTFPERTNIRMSAFVNEAVKFLGYLVPSTVKLTTRLEEDTGVVLIDGPQLETVLTNLVVNAIDAMDGMTGELAIILSRERINGNRTRRVPRLGAGDYAKLSVRDTGCGMDESTMSHIFDPFFTTKSDDSGTGLGLSTVYGIISSNNGAIDVTSTPDQGTTFDIYLPLVDPANGVDKNGQINKR